MTRGRLVAVILAAAALGAGLWFWLTAPARRSREIFARFQKRTAVDDARGLERELEAHYREHPRQARRDWDAYPDWRGIIAGACAVAPGAKGVAEEALKTLPPDHRVYVILCVATGGHPTFSAGTWTGTDALSVPEGWKPFFQEARGRETHAEVAALYATALFASGWNPGLAELARLAREDPRPPQVAAATLVAWARQPGAPAALIGALGRRELPDGVASQLLASGALAGDPGYAAFVESWALDRANAVAAGGAFAVLARQFPALQERLWENARAVPPGSRLPLMLSLTSGAKWPAPYLRWWVIAWEEEVKRHGAVAEDALRAPATAALPVWILEEKDESLKRSLKAIFDHIRARR